jgi:uncharacterized protein (DUF736 family)
MRGYIYPNNKGDNPKRPDYRGKLDDGQVIAGWLTFDQTGKQYIALTISTAPVLDSADPEPVAA